MPNQPAVGKVHITLYLSEELRDGIREAAAEGGESVSGYTRRLWEEDLKRRQRLKHPPASAAVEWDLP